MTGHRAEMTATVPPPPVARAKLAVLTNVLAPYRVPIFRHLATRFDVSVVLSGKEGNREKWSTIEHQPHAFAVKRSRGLTFAWTKRDKALALDTRYLHIDPRLFSELRRIQPDAIISDEMGFRSLVALAYGRLYRCPVWVWWGGTPHTERGINAARRLFRRWLAPAVPRWFSYGVTSTEYLLSLGVDRQRVVELQNCVPEGDYGGTVSPAFAVGPAPVMLCVARLVPGKGVDLLLHAAARLQGEGLEFSVLIVGDGPERPALEALATRLGLRHVHFRAALPPGDVSRVYRSGDALVFPTLDDVWGLVVNEALLSGVPALVSIYAGCARELVPAASTFDPLDPSDFTLKLRAAVMGRLPAPEPARIRRVDEVSATLARDVETNLRARC